ncbi:2-oxoglutarate and Fe(II)-dependent oxygenase superfamily protein [Prunus dulcis]|uniref:2-oxoglutarate and Fe(II)-dependent oxygenase superfamily protein n=1 Tax=Prunus dulcis TaxID=3755 RepID=A0A4Y1RQX6_PRUDU|nr:2-oxoglutarate and Fe(II)-dependent oxygenase superfamily protein [Prunus dulcis]
MGSKSMEKVASKVEAIADQVSEVLFANAEKQVEKKMRSELGKVRLYRYNHQDHSMEQNPSSNYLQNEIINGNNLRECEDHHALCLHLPLEHSQFNIRSEGEGGSLCFDAGPETLVVTVGNQLENLIRGYNDHVQYGIHGLKGFGLFTPLNCIMLGALSRLTGAYNIAHNEMK